MPSFVVKPVRDRDEYVYWSTIVEAPLAWGDRTQMAEYLRDKGEEGDGRRIDRADATGSSAFEGVFGWADDEVIYQQQGNVRRSDLWELCERLGSGRPVDDLITPWEDD